MFVPGGTNPFNECSNPSTSDTYYKLDPKKLEADECHIFFPSILCDELLLCMDLEHFTFPPDTPLNDKYKFRIVRCGTIDIQWASFPKKFRKVCEKAVEYYNMNYNKGHKVIVDFRGSKVVLTEGENILLFAKNGRPDWSEEKFDREVKQIIEMGKLMQKQGVD